MCYRTVSFCVTYTANYTVETTAKTFEIVEYLRRHGRTGVSELSDELGIPKSIVHNHVSTLRELEYARKRGGEYQLSIRFLQTGIDVRSQSNLFQQMERKLVVVAKQFGTTAVLVERDGSGAVVTALHRETDGSDIALELGTRIELSDAPFGHAVLTELSEDDRRDVDGADWDVERARESTPSDRTVFTSPHGDGASPTFVAAGVTVDDDVGAVGVELPRTADDDVERSVRNAVASLSKAFATEAGQGRSFATTKHSWFSG